VSLVLGGLVVVLAIAVLLLFRRTGKLARRLDAMTRGANGRSLEGTLEAHVDKVYAVARELDSIEARTAILEGAQRRAFQRVGLVRFNPFEDTGGNQSFAVALLDATGDGFVLSSLHARAATRVYAKTVAAGRAESALSKEEQEALKLALASFGEARRAS
jgi:hypothetical protein